MSTFLLGLGVAFAIEGLLYAAFPRQMKQMMLRVLDTPEASMRTVGIVVLAVGVVVVWLAQT